MMYLVNCQTYTLLMDKGGAQNSVFPGHIFNAVSAF